jgi:peptidoglycan/LPS O-acetylase OafA/YrhL
MIYRYELDGLRAISVMSVILYHMGISQIGAGYAGVDIFFVISGFLIGGQIAKDRAQGTFTYWNFYARRALRIFPALFFVIICSTIAGWFIMLPHEFRYFGGGALSALLSVSNFWFWDTIDYFNPEAALDPLVHTWSLAVEEQFYMFVPLLFGLFWGLGQKTLLMVLISLAFASFITALTTNSDSPMTAFYLLHTRAWELLIGVIAALKSDSIKSFKPNAALMSNIGLILIVAGLTILPNNSLWPGGWTLVPVIGSLLILLFGREKSFAHAVLKLAPLRFIGLISYSAYLWHQPILSFLAIKNISHASGTDLLIIFTLILLISYLSWRLVEQPFRKKTLPLFYSRSLLILASVFITAFAIGGHFTNGYPERVPSSVRQVMQSAKSPDSLRECQLSRKQVQYMSLSETCEFGANIVPSVAVWGDSHAASISQPLGEALGEIGLSLKQFTLSSCQPIPNLINFGQSRTDQCAKFNSEVFSKLLISSEIKTIVMFATWDSYFLNKETPNMLGVLGVDEFYSYPVGHSPDLSDETRKEKISNELKQVIKELTAVGKRIILVASLPRPDINIPNYFARQVWNGVTLNDNVGYPVEMFVLQSSFGRKMLKEASNYPKDGNLVKLVDPADIFCGLTECALIKEGQLLYVDGNHPSTFGSSLLIRPILNILSKLE